MKFYCPHTNLPLKRATIKNQPIWFSSDSLGRLMTRTISRHLIGTHETQEIWYRARLSKEVSSKQCPQCRKNMKFVETPTWIGTKEMDVCCACHLFWFENNAFPNIPKVNDFLSQFGDTSRVSEVVALQTKNALDQERLKNEKSSWWGAGPANDIERILGHCGFPIEIEDPYNFTQPLLTYSITFICILVLILSYSNYQSFIETLGFVSAHPFNNLGLNFFTHAFMHGGLGHLFGNLIFFYVFSDDVEETLGPKNYTVFFIFTCLLVGMVNIIFNNTEIPLVGLSGFVFACLVFYALDNPNTKIGFSTLPFWGPLVIFKIISRSPIAWIHISAKFLFIYYIAKEVIMFIFFEIPGATNVSHLSHLAGGISGYLMYKFHNRDNFTSVQKNH